VPSSPLRGRPLDVVVSANGVVPKRVVNLAAARCGARASRRPRFIDLARVVSPAADAERHATLAIGRNRPHAQGSRAGTNVATGTHHHWELLMNQNTAEARARSASMVNLSI